MARMLPSSLNVGISRSFPFYSHQFASYLVQKTQGLQRLDGIEPAWRRMGHPWHRGLHELAVWARWGRLAEHNQEVAIDARHGHHVVAGAYAAADLALGVVSKGERACLAVSAGRGCGDVELQIQGALLLLGLGPLPALLHGLPVQCIRQVHELTAYLSKYCSASVSLAMDSVMLAPRRGTAPSRGAEDRRAGAPGCLHGTWPHPRRTASRHCCHPSPTTSSWDSLFCRSPRTPQATSAPTTAPAAPPSPYL